MAYRGITRSIEGATARRTRRRSAGKLDDERIVTFLRQPFLAASWYDLLPLFPINVALARMLDKSLDVLGREQEQPSRRASTWSASTAGCSTR